VNVACLLEWGARRHAGRTAFVCEGREWSFVEIDRAASRLAGALAELGARKGDRVAVMVANRPEYAVAEFAIAKAGAVRVPLLITLTAQELTAYLDFARVDVMVFSGECAAAVRAAAAAAARDVALIALDGAAPGEHDFQQLIDGASPAGPVDLVEEDPYAIRFTGGTTGVPKAVLMPQRSMVHIITNQLLNWDVSDRDVGLSIHPLSHAAGMMMYAWWVRGATHVIRPAFRLDPHDVLSTIERHRVTTTFMIPTVLNVLLDSDAVGRYDTSSLRAVVYGGAPIPQQRLREALQAFGPVFVQIYGTTEAPYLLTTLLAHEHAFAGDEPPARLGSAGRVGLGVEVLVVDEDGRRCPPGVPGEVISRGPHTMVGYWDNPQLTAQRLRDGWVHTDDIGQFDEDGYLYIVDRKDDLVISGGFNVWPAEVEDAIYRHPAVREAAVFGIEHRKWGEAVVAVVVPKEGEQPSQDELLAFLKDRLANYKVPKSIAFRDDLLPRSPVGKPLRRTVRDQHHDALQRALT